MKGFLITLLLLMVFTKATQADWLSGLPRFNCIPEMEYFAIDVLEVDEIRLGEMGLYEKESISKDIFEKHGILLDDGPKEYKCDLGDKIIKVDIEYYRNPFDAPRYSCSGNNYEHHGIKVWFANKTGKEPENYKLVFDDVITWYCNYGGVKALIRLEYHSGRFFVNWRIMNIKRFVENMSELPNQSAGEIDDPYEKCVADYDPTREVLKEDVIFVKELGK